MRSPAVRERRTNLMARAMNKTGRPMWLTFHCTYEPGMVNHPGNVFQPWCAQDGNSWRIGPDHHDNWASLETVIEVLGAQAEHGRPFRWNDPDFLMTGGAGCNSFEPGKRCPGMSETEYRTEFSLWVLGAASMIVSTDVRDMSPFMRATLLHKEMLSIHQDPMGISGGLVYADDTVCTQKGYCQQWARPLSGGRWAMALYNRNDDNATVTGLFTQLPPQPTRSILGTNKHAGAAPQTLHVHDVWANADLGAHSGSYSRELAPHATAVLLLTPA